MMPDLTPHATVADLAAVVALVDKTLAADMLESSPLVNIIVDTEDALAFTASWLLESRTQARPLHLAVTVIQTTIGGLSGGEGWGEQTQHVARGILTPDEARTIASLTAGGLMPVRASWKEI